MIANDLAYMSPELARNLPSPRTEIYRLGMLGFEILTGQPAFSGDVGKVFYQIVSVVPPRVDSLVPVVPAAPKAAAEALRLLKAAR